MKRARAIEFPVGRRGLRRPLWRGLARQIAWQIDLGRLAAGSRVPSVRGTAQRLGVSRTTVAWAFESLIADGYLAARVGDGTYVLDESQRSRPPAWRRQRRWLRDPDGLLLSIARI
jgi:GntR family transcriptional regulator/MocR family aminotransferase